jgi:hypothetical protein
MTNKQQSLLSIPITAVKLMLVIIVLALTAPGNYILALPFVIYNYGVLLTKINSQFRFEDHQTKEAAQKKLLELYPVGSDVNKFVKDMQSLGYQDLPTDDLENGSKIVSFEHYIRTSVFTSITWYATAGYSNGKITNIAVGQGLSAP